MPGGGFFVRLQVAGIVVLVHLDALDLAGADLILERAIGDDRVVALEDEEVEEGDGDQHDQDVADGEPELESVEVGRHQRALAPQRPFRPTVACGPILCFSLPLSLPSDGSAVPIKCNQFVVIEARAEALEGRPALP